MDDFELSAYIVINLFGGEFLDCGRWSLMNWPSRCFSLHFAEEGGLYERKEKRERRKSEIG